MHRFFLISLMLVCFTSTAGIYKWVDADGNIHYSDTEVKGSEEVELSKGVTYTPTTQSTTTTKKEEAKEKKSVYSEMSIIQPKMNETVRDNSGNVTVITELTPALRPGDKISLYLDGKEALKGSTKTSITLTNVDRGSHTVKTSVIGKNGKILISTKSVIFHLHRKVVEEKDSTSSDSSSSSTYEEKAKDYNKGVPSGSGTFSPGSSYTPKYNQ